MSTVGLQPASSSFARANFEKTLRKPVKLSYVSQFLSVEDAAALEKAHPKGSAHVWGVKYERVPQWAALIPDDCVVLFRQGNRPNDYRSAQVRHGQGRRWRRGATGLPALR